MFITRIRTIGTILLPLLGVLLLAACKSLPREDDGGAPDTVAAMPREVADDLLREASEALQNDNPLRARQVLSALEDDPRYVDDVATLRAAIDLHLRRKTEEAAQLLAEQRMAAEVEERLGLPATYGQTVHITRETADDVRVPPGPMERLVNRKISLHVNDASVKDLLVALSEIEDINLIADKVLGTDQGAESASLTVHADDLPLRDVLAYIARNMGIAFHITEDVIWVTDAPLPPPDGRGPAMETQVFRLRSGFIPTLKSGESAVQGQGFTPELRDAGRDDELLQVLDTFLADSPDGAVHRIFPHRNLLVVRNTREKLRLVEALLSDFDREPLQVLIEARFISLSQNDLLKLGLSVNQLIAPGNGQVVGFGDLAQSPTIESIAQNVNGKVTEVVTKTESNMSPALSMRKLEASGTFPGTLTLSGILGNTTYVAVLDALRQLGSSKILSVPRITVANNHTARIHRGTKRYYFEEYDISTIDEGDSGTATKLVPVGKPREIDLGYLLDVTVNVGNNGETVMLALKPQINDISGWELFDSAKLPILDENTLETTVVVKSGETVVLGGMMTKSVSKQQKRVPVLSSIPLIGRLFTNKSEEDQPFHLLIFVNAQVIHNDGRLVEYDDAG